MPDLFISLSLLLNLILLILLFLSYQRLSALQIGQEQLTKGFREEITRLREDMLRTQKEGREELSAHLASQLQTEIRLLESFSNQLSEHTRLNDEKLERIRGTVEGQLASLREENGKKLEEMRQTVMISFRVRWRNGWGNPFAS
ncbi:hypothetical protein CULT_10167 [[Clostridium] ultunense Esp]|nr:hypothetical protein CULT_10167 [[Clostridium] ultunense Esp]